MNQEKIYSITETKRGFFIVPDGVGSFKIGFIYHCGEPGYLYPRITLSSAKFSTKETASDYISKGKASVMALGESKSGSLGFLSTTEKGKRITRNLELCDRFAPLAIPESLTCEEFRFLGVQILGRGFDLRT